MNKAAQTVIVGVAGIAMIGAAVWLGLRAMPATPGPGNAGQTAQQAPAAPPTPEERLERLRHAVDNEPNGYYRWQPYVNALLAMDRTDDALAACAEMKEYPAVFLDAHALEAGVHASRGESDEAFADLEVAYLTSEGLASGALLTQNPPLAAIADDPRFPEFRENIAERMREMFERSEKAAAERPGMTGGDQK